MLYPASVLVGKNAQSDYLGIAVASKNQNQDTGAKVTIFAAN
jgi:Fe-S cluster assembly protein SufB